MNTVELRSESKAKSKAESKTKVVLICVLLIAVGWFLWFYALDHIVMAGGYSFAAIVGLTVGILSGLPPKKAFQACFYGFCVVALLLFMFPNVAVSQVFIGALSGLFGMAGAILRRIVLHQEIEIHLKSWQWTLLIGGVTLFADYTTIPSILLELYTYQDYLFLAEFFVPVLIGLFALGLFVGAFSHLEYKELMRSVVKLSLEFHGLYLVIMIFAFLAGQIRLQDFLIVPLIGLFLVIVLKGIQIGYRQRNREIIKSGIENTDQ